jgi:hypothetical protein
MDEMSTTTVTKTNPIKQALTQNIVQFIKDEPVIFWSLLAGLGNMVQLLAIPIAPWLHIVIGILSWVGATVLARSRSVPVTSVNVISDPPEPPAVPQIPVTVAPVGESKVDSSIG